MNASRKSSRAMRAALRRAPASLMISASVLLLVPAESLAAAVARFIHAVPSAGKVTVEITQDGSSEHLEGVGFGDVSPWENLRPGPFQWALESASKTLAHGSARIGNGAYDLVFLQEGTAVKLGVYRADGGRSGTSLVRVIHAAPGLGSPQLRLDSKVAVPSLSFTAATPYVSITPGQHTLSATPANSTVPLISVSAPFQAGKSYSEIVIGSDGQRVRVLSLVDRGAPLTRAVIHRSTTSAATTSSSSEVVVEPGDSLWQIAQRRLGSQASDASIVREYVAIWTLNKDRIGTGDPSLIFPGQRLVLPRI